MQNFFIQFNWLLEGAVTAGLVLFFTWLLDHRKNKRHIFNITAAIAIELRSNYRELVIAKHSGRKLDNYSRDTWDNIKYDLAKYLPLRYYRELFLAYDVFDTFKSNPEKLEDTVFFKTSKTILFSVTDDFLKLSNISKLGLFEISDDEIIKCFSYKYTPKT